MSIFARIARICTMESCVWRFFSIYCIMENMSIQKIATIIICVICLAGCTGQGSGAPTSGIMKSEDGGRTFTPRNVIDEQHSIGKSNVFALAIDPRNSNTIYAGTEGDGVYVSHDGANTWSAVNTGLTNIGGIVIDPQDARIIYVGGMFNGRGSVIQSKDAGENWERVYVEPQDGTNITAMIMLPGNTQTIFIGTSGGTIARTSNAGTTWENVHKAGNSIDVLGIGAKDTHAIYALISGADMIISRDDGASFMNVRDMQRDYETQKIYDGIAYAMTVDPHRAGSVVVGTDQGLFRTYDYGYHWEAIDVIASTIGLPVYAIAISPHDAQRLVFAVAKAVYTSVASGWAITDTTSAYAVDVITHDPNNPQVVYIGLKRSQ